jgi:hypothetical protein
MLPSLARRDDPAILREAQPSDAGRSRQPDRQRLQAEIFSFIKSTA